MINDNELYIASKDFVRKELSDYYNKTEEVIILSVSRKGPKFLECLFGKEDTDSLNTITEVALPFCMKRLSGIKKNWIVKVFDDAVYYGTTVEGIIHELEDFEGLYGIQSKKELYTAVRAIESHTSFKDNLKNVVIHSFNDDNDEPLRKGYGHYFIRRLEKDLSQIGNTLEIEFPIVEFNVDGVVDKDRLFSSLIDEYGKDRCYVVNHYEYKSLSIDLDEEDGQSFCKMRIYVKDSCVRVVCMAPWILPNDILVLLSILKESPFFGIWLNLMEAYTEPSITKRSATNAYTFMTVERSIRKSLIIMANYLLSCGMLISQKSRILRAFMQTGQGFTFKGVHIADLFYLLGDKELCEKIKDKVNDIWDLGLSDYYNLTRPNYKKKNSNLDYQIFEQRNFPEPEEINVFERHNKAMLTQSGNISEALSALFYNQTALIEKWSRRNEKYDFGRLRFGYTYSSLAKELQESKIADITNQTIKEIHQWVDGRIDQACIVPQYVVDYKTNQWCRVFRPGENEDALLSHLTRYVLAVFDSMDQVQQLGWIYKDLFEELLCLSAYHVEGLDDSFEFTLEPDMVQRKLFLKYSNGTTKRSVFNYMTDMNILKVDNDMVSVTKELADDDLRIATTLDYEVEKYVKDKVIGIMKLVTKLKYQQYPFFVTNIYFYQSGQINEIAQYNENYLSSLKETIGKIERGEERQALSLFLYNNYISSKKYIVSIDVFTDDDIISSLILNTEDKLKYAREMIVMWKIKFLYEIVIVSQLYPNFDLLKEEMETGKGFDAYGYRLEWNEDTLQYFRHLLEKTDNVQEIRSRSLSWVKNQADKIPYVKVWHHE